MGPASKLRPTSSRGRALRNGCLVGLVTVALCVAILELLGQTPLGAILPLERFREVVHVVKDDVDHRNRAGSRPDLNSDGIRSLVEPDVVESESLNIIFLGDSFVFGSGLRDQHTVSRQLEELIRGQLGLDANVFNFGWVSSSPLLSLRLLRDIGDKYQPDLVMLGLDMTDFRDDLLYSNVLQDRRVFRLRRAFPAGIVGLDMLLEATGSDRVKRALFGIPADRFFITAQPLEDSRPYLGPLFASLEAIHDYSAERWNAPFVLFLFPRSYQYTDVESPESWERNRYENLGRYVLEPFRLFREAAGQLPYPQHSLLEAFAASDIHPHCFKTDPHWNRKGAGIAAAEIFRQAQDAGYFSTTVPPGAKS